MSSTPQSNDLKNRILFTVFILAVYRLGTFVPLPGIDPEQLQILMAGNQKGLGAVGYLLHDNDLEHSCSSLVSTTSDWNSKSESDRKTLRCSAALKIAQDVASAALSVRDQWVNSYRSDLVSESSAGDNLQAVSDAIFYYEKGIKDKKLGIPLGINAGCSALSCPAQVESQYSLSSLQSIRINSESFLKVFQGGSGRGFDDFIGHEGFPEVSARFATNTNAVIDAVATIEVPLYEQATSINTEALIYIASDIASYE